MDIEYTVKEYDQLIYLVDAFTTSTDNVDIKDGLNDDIVMKESSTGIFPNKSLTEMSKKYDEYQIKTFF